MDDDDDDDDQEAFDDWIDAYIDRVDAAIDAYLAPPGRCSRARHAQLQAPVHRMCDVSRACSDSMRGCRSTSQYILRNALCAQARRAINRECYGGGNLGHRMAENQARIAAATCRARWNALGCGGRRSLPRNVQRFD